MNWNLMLRDLFSKKKINSVVVGDIFILVKKYFLVNIYLLELLNSENGSALF